MDCSSDIEPLDDALAAMASLVPGIIAESALFGMFSLLVLFSTFILLRRGTGFLPNLSMLAATMVMYLSAASHWALDIYTLMKQIQDPRGFRPVYSWSVGTTVVVFLNFWFSDFIVIWRACILWQWDRRVVAISAALLFATLTFASLNVAFSRPPSNNPAFQVDVFGIVGLAMSLMANLWATSLIAVRAWSHRRSIKAHLNNGSRKTAVQSIMALLVESGILYCIVWAMFILSKIAKLGRFRHSLANAIPQLTGIYPTVIIVLVCLQKTHCDRRFTYNRATHRRGIGYRPKLLMLAATLVMYLSGVAHWALDIYTLTKQIRDPLGWNDIWSVGTTVVVFLNFWFSDIIVLWRAWIVWSRNRIIVAISAVLLCSTVLFSALNVAFRRPGDAIFHVDIFGVLGLVMSLVSNLWATSLIGIKAWSHRRSIKDHLSDGNRKSAVQSIMALLVESGFLYIIMHMGINNTTALGKFHHVLANAVPQLTGIYPTVIIVLVCLHQTHCDRNFTYDTPVHSAFVAARRAEYGLSHRTAGTGTQGASAIVLEVGDAYFSGGHQQQRKDSDSTSAIGIAI
ncbi:hypothetical protein OF83DRAFT_1061836 [Amylostereum chailletii]|nr:hypothetical protein OF83DRAFT_1061836 [Amylostereum chailletii]